MGRILVTYQIIVHASAESAEEVDGLPREGVHQALDIGATDIVFLENAHAHTYAILASWVPVVPVAKGQGQYGAEKRLGDALLDVFKQHYRQPVELLNFCAARNVHPIKILSLVEVFLLHTFPQEYPQFGNIYINRLRTRALTYPYGHHG